jgi:hypothetical protein
MMRAAWLPIFALLLPAPLLAADQRELFDAGAKALSTGRADEALAAFEASYKAEPSPSLLFWIGEAHLALGHKQRAARYYRQYLEKLPAGIKAGDAQMRLTLLKHELPEPKQKSRSMALEEVDLSKRKAEEPAKKHSRRKGKKRGSARSESAPPAAAPALPLPGAQPAPAQNAATPPPAPTLPGAQPAPAQNAATPSAAAAAPVAPPPETAQKSGAPAVATPAPAAGTQVAQVQPPAPLPAAPPEQPRPRPTATGPLVTPAPEPGTYTYVNYTARLLAPNGSFMARYATTGSPGNGTLYTHGISIGRQTEYFKNGVYVGLGLNDGGQYLGGTDTLRRYELSWEGIWVPLGSDSIFSPYVGVRIGGMGVISERLTGGPFRPGVVLAGLAGIGLQLGPFALTGGMGYDQNLGPDLGPNASISGYSFDLGATLRF